MALKTQQQQTTVIYKLLYTLLHWLVEVGCWVHEAFRRLHSLRHWTGVKTLDDYRKDPGLKRIPKHVGIVLTEEPIDFNDLANVVMWCIAAGTTVITLYDHDGVIKNSSNELYEILQSTKNKLLGSHFQLKVGALNDSINNNMKAERILINLCSQSDGCQYLANVASDICRSVKEGSMSPSEIDMQTISDYFVSDYCAYPDPDLVIRFGELESTLGFLPWNIRLSEILSISSLQNVSYEEFHRVLLRFNLCEQRHGQ